MRGGQWTDVHTADYAYVCHGQAVHRARVLDGVRHAAGQVRVSHQPQRWRLPTGAVPSALVVLHGGYTTGHRRPVAHLLAPAIDVVSSKCDLQRPNFFYSRENCPDSRPFKVSKSGRSRNISL